VTALVGEETRENVVIEADPALVTELQGQVATLERKLAAAHGLSEDIFGWMVEAEQERDALGKGQASWEEERASLLGRVQAIESQSSQVEPLRRRMRQLENELERTKLYEATARQDAIAWRRDAAYWRQRVPLSQEFLEAVTHWVTKPSHVPAGGIRIIP